MFEALTEESPQYSSASFAPITVQEEERAVEKGVSEVLSVYWKGFEDGLVVV